MARDSDSLGTIDDPARGAASSASIEAALGIALGEVATLTAEEQRRAGFDAASLPALAEHVQGLLRDGDRTRAARVVYAALSLVLRAHARLLLHPASATTTHRAAVDRIGAAMSALAAEHGQRSVAAKVDDEELPGLRPQRRPWRLGRRRR